MKLTQDSICLLGVDLIISYQFCTFLPKNTKVAGFHGKGKSCGKLRPEANFAARESRDAAAKNSGDSLLLKFIYLIPQFKQILI